MTSRPRTRIPSRPSLGALLTIRIALWLAWFAFKGDFYKLLTCADYGRFSYSLCPSDSVGHESVGSTPLGLLLFGDIPTVIPSTSVRDPYVATIACWRSRVTARPSSSYEFPIAPCVKLLDCKEGEIRHLTARRLASRLASPRSPRFITHLLLQFIFGFFANCVTSSESTTGRSKAYRRWCADPLSTGPSRKRCRSPVDSVPLSMPVTGSLAPTRADHLPPRMPGLTQRSMRLTPALEVGLAEVSTPMTAPLVEEEIVEPAGEDSPDLPVTRDGIDRIVGIETAQGRLEADQLIASGDRARMAEAIYSLRLENLKIRAMLDI
ncbi:hypothetical protein Tco_1058380 [Tanacetum coccineum]|uniref:Uncharacterized protein n=1 Tax=Tanacetum coccineum TaxID=301880 RepID=A0ABQ5HA58_9ASTR